jgi:hypothetical protein
MERFREDAFPMRPQISLFREFPQTLLDRIQARPGEIEAANLGRRHPFAEGAFQDQAFVPFRASEHQEASGSLVVTPQR